MAMISVLGVLSVLNVKTASAYESLMVKLRSTSMNERRSTRSAWRARSEP